MLRGKLCDRIQIYHPCTADQLEGSYQVHERRHTTADYQTFCALVVLLDNVREPILTPGFLPDDNIFRIAVVTESRLISEETCPSGLLSTILGGFFLCFSVKGMQTTKCLV
ncbi:hypothetical protein TNCT_675491 [Trichonephila clavata]|uniref:Uncharacterized protein n=1 Tax=Trichonephila clavata TaxID=2740835 RepID=A0A8X6I4M9_TRICU|nr:hypothetical protein TNCT_675491 [Trichonephila clavata]